MGKPSKKKETDATASSPTLQAYFSAAGSQSEAQAPLEELQKMAPTDLMVGEVPAGAISRADLAEQFNILESSLTKKIEKLISPLTSQLLELKATVKEVSQTADSAMELGLTLQDFNRQMQQQMDWVAEKLMYQENQSKILNLKFRGFKEGAEENKDLMVFMSEWLATQLDLEGGVTPLLDMSFRIGAPRRNVAQASRDIIVKFRDARTKQRIWIEARSKGYLSYKDSKISVMQDLSSETLTARKALKPVTLLLQQNNIRYRWAGYIKLQIIHQGKAMLAYDLDSGKQLLKDLGISLPADFPSGPSTLELPIWKKN